ncbi:hypothetical protein M446_1159 [Methylobacterium sp. 4-46]|nr:hypothetical protein M446_1159 [Methylobacterium sp. 4-46]
MNTNPVPCRVEATGPGQARSSVARVSCPPNASLPRPGGAAIFTRRRPVFSEHPRRSGEALRGNRLRPVGRHSSTGCCDGPEEFAPA